MEDRLDVVERATYALLGDMEGVDHTLDGIALFAETVTTILIQNDVQRQLDRDYIDWLTVKFDNLLLENQMLSERVAKLETPSEYSYLGGGYQSTIGTE